MEAIRIESNGGTVYYYVVALKDAETFALRTYHPDPLTPYDILVAFPINLN